MTPDGAPSIPGDLAERLGEILWADPLIRDRLRRARDLGAPRWRMVSGAVYNTVWNALTARPPGYGIKDIDLAYFDADASWEAEDRWIRRAAQAFPDAPPIELRNQARVPLWYPKKFGTAYPPIQSVEEGLRYYAAQTHAVGVRLEADDRIDVCAPFGLADVFALRLTPNPALPNAETYRRKAARAKALWPEIAVAPWPEDAVAGTAM